MRVLQESIRPVLDELPDMPHPFGFIRKAEPQDAGNDAGVYPAEVRGEDGTGDEGKSYWYCIHYCLDSKVKHMTEAEVKDWAICNGYKIDGQVKREWVHG